MSSLATHVQAYGGGDESIEKIDDGICNLSPEDVVQKLCSDVNPRIREFTCYIEISAPRPVASSLFAGLKFAEAGLKEFKQNQTALSWNDKRAQGVVVKLVVTAPSRQKGAEMALADVLSLVHLHALYSNNVMVIASPRILIKDDDQFYVVDATPGRHFGLEPRRNSERSSRERYKELGSRLDGRIGNVLESHALAVSATDARSAVFHLWNALETLTSGLGSGNIGEDVAEVVAPIIAWKRIDKIATYFSISGHELQAHVGATYDFTNFPRSSKRQIDRSDVMKAITGPKDNPAILSAFSNFAPSPLLNYRLYRAWEECHDPMAMHNSLLLSQRRIKWQMMRFYRARNLLVHYGEVDNLALRLLEDAQYYLSTCVGRVLHDLASFANWNVNTSLEFQRSKFESLVARTETKPEDVKLGELLVSAEQEYADDPVWPDGHKPKRAKQQKQSTAS